MHARKNNNDERARGHIETEAPEAADPYLVGLLGANAAATERGYSEAMRTVFDELGGAPVRRRAELLKSLPPDAHSRR